jgi:hypothetical protein
MPMKKVMPIERFTMAIGKDEIVRLAKLLVRRPHPLYRREDDSVLIDGTSRLPASVFTSSNSSS